MVVSNIPPYSIVPGNSAKVIYRGIELNDVHKMVSLFGSIKKIKKEKTDDEEKQDVGIDKILCRIEVKEKRSRKFWRLRRNVVSLQLKWSK